MFSSSMRLAALVFASLSLVSSVLGAPLRERAQLCNGHAELCERPYGNTTFLGSHDSFAFSGNPFALARTQEVDLQHQLALGVRMLQAQGHMQKDVLHFCHTTCGLFDGGSVESYLTIVKRWLDSHPNEVLTLVFTNPEKASVDTVWAPIFQKTGIADMAFVPAQTSMTRDDWPTLGEMISSGKRVVIFLDHGAEARSDLASAYILPQFQMMWEDKYDPTNSAFPCAVDRTAGPLAPGQQLNLINHNLNADIFPIGRGILIPDRLSSPRTNGVNSIVEHVAHCAPLTNDHNPNFVMLDYVNVGQGMAAVNRLNGFRY